MPSKWLNRPTRQPQLQSLMRSMLDRLPRKESRRPHQVEAQGYCLSCRKVTVNRLIVVGHLMKSRRCECCGHVMRARPLRMAECYADEFVDRLGDLVKRAKPTQFRCMTGWDLLGIPHRAVRKVLRETAYVSDLFLEEAE